MFALIIMWILSVFVIFWAMVGYPASIMLLDKLFPKSNKKDESYEPTVAVMVVAHNEEKVIEDKLKNLLELDYPSEKLVFLIASDFSTDRTDEIVETFIKNHADRNIQLNRSVNHKGKTNAQNETQALCQSEILVMTDANAMFQKNAVRELVSSFSAPDIAYVSGQLKYVNTEGNQTANSEGFYWKLDLKCREVESRIQTITAGNGAIYAVRNRDYKIIPPIECHDSSFPVLYALEKKRAIYNPDAIAFEKAGEENEDEFKRKVRMSRGVLRGILPDIRILNVFSHHWFSYFYFGHRTCRYLLWLMHILAFVLNIPLAILGGWFWIVVFAAQVLFYALALLGYLTRGKNKFARMAFYYCLTVLAQWKGVINILTGKTKPVWEKAESTR